MADHASATTVGNIIKTLEEHQKTHTEMLKCVTKLTNIIERHEARISLLELEHDAQTR